MAQIKKYLVKYNNGESIVHWDGPYMPGDMSLCGSDLIGDVATGEEGWAKGVLTTKKVNCDQCLRLINHVINIQKQTKK